MHPFHEYIRDQLVERLKKHRVVVWYDARGEFQPFLQEVLGGEPVRCAVQRTDFDDLPVGVCAYGGSLFEIKFVVEPDVGCDEPQPLLIYVPAERPPRTESPLAELEKAGDTYEPQLKRLARNVLRQQYSDGQIDDMLASDAVSYADVVGLLADDDGRQKSMLKVIFADARDNGQLLADWIAQPELDNMVQEKAGGAEILQLARSRLGLELGAGGDLDDARRQVLRYVLVGEFRSDYDGDPPVAAAMIPAPTKREQEKLIGEIAVALRSRHPEAYLALADRVESELGFSAAALPPERLGRIDTFRFEERSLLRHVGQLIVERRYEEAARLVTEHRRSFWTDREVRRQNQWEVCRWMAEVGVLAGEVRRTLPTGSHAPTSWIERYTADDGWYRLDLAQRRLESLVASITEDPECEAALNRVRADYEAVLQDMSSRFLDSLRAAGWSLAGVLSQTRIHADLVAGAGRTALILVDSLRYEMGVELREQLSDADELTLTAAVAAIPTITPIGMAALLPGASASFTVTDDGGEPAAVVDGSAVAGLQARQKYLKSRVPDLIDLELGRLLGMAPSDLRKRKNFDDASLIVVRSQDIDALGETGSNHVARQVMDTAVGNVARAVRKLADLGVERFVIAADHGHLFTWAKEEAMRMDSPGGETLDLHRRCWIGRGGTTPACAVRINGAELGYRTDLDFVFPSGISVFRAGGDLAYHHGGLSLQELVIPVLVVRMVRRGKPTGGVAKLTVGEIPATLTNRTFGVTLSAPVDLFHAEPAAVRPVLLYGGVLVGEAGMALDAEYDQKTHCVVVQPGKTARVAMFLQNDNCDKIRLVVLDPATDAVLFQSNDIQVKLGTK